MNDDLNSMFRELKEIEAAISQSREMVEVIQKHLDHLPPEFLRDVQKVIAPLDIRPDELDWDASVVVVPAKQFRVGDRVRAKDTGHVGEVVDLFTGIGGTVDLTVLWDSGVVENFVGPGELEHERERDQP